jgi:hypothetical protein
MAERTPKQLVGVTDGTLIPAKLADGGEVGGSTRTSIFSKVTGTTWAVNDTVRLGIKPAGHKVVSIKLVTGTSLSTTTIDVGTAADPDKYVDGATLTTTNRVTEIGVMAAAMDDDPGAEEDLYATILTTDIGSAVELSFIVETIGVT